jgi:SAM-dependent methyltransferase
MTIESVAGRPADQVHDAVRDRYAAAARSVTAGATATCCGPAADVSDAGGCGCGTTTLALEPGLGVALYSAAERDGLPEDAVSASLGCGNPFAVADVRPGDRVLDLGSGGGIDVLLSARRVGPTGFAYGVDMTEEMLDLARRNAVAAGAANVEFLHGHIEDVPLPDAAVDVVISNCVVNLSPDKAAVLREAHRVLAPGGRLGITDIVADDDLGPDERAARGSWVGCIAGALSFGELRRLLGDAGFVDAEIEATHEVAPGMHSALVRARKPGPAGTPEPAGGVPAT